MNQIEEKHSNNSDNTSNNDSDEEKQDSGCLFDINEEIYELLLRNMITNFDEKNNIQLEINNIKEEKAEVQKANLKFQEISIYSQQIIVNQKKVLKKASLVYLDDNTFKKENYENMSLDFQFINQIRDINIAKIAIQTIDICVELLTSVDHTLKDLKLMTLKNLEALFKESFSNYDLDIFVFSFKEIMIPKQDEELSLRVMISKNHLEDSLIGNVFNINMKINDQRNEMDIMKTVMLKSKEPSERLRSMIKFENNSKISKRILIIKTDTSDDLHVLILKLKEDDEIAFPMNSIKNIEKVPFKRGLTEGLEEIRIKIRFVDELKWSDLYIWFLAEKLYLNFLEIFLEYSVKKQKKSMKTIVPLDDLKKVSTQKNDRIMNESMSLEEILQQTQDINMILDHIEEKEHKHFEEEKKKLDDDVSKNDEIFEKAFVARIKSILKIKCERIIKFTNSFEVEVFASGKTSKVLYCYNISEIADISLLDHSEKVILDLKNKKLKYIKIYFNNFEEAQAFVNYYHNVILENFKKFHSFESSGRPLLKKDIKRYSWLCQQNVYNISKMKDIKNKFYSGKIVDIQFNVINITKKGDQNQILHLNFINNVITLLKPNQDLVKQMEVKKILGLYHSYYDNRKVFMSLKQRNLLNKPKKIELVFQDVKTKFLFFSSFYSILYPELKEIPKPKFRVYITTWNVGFSEPPNNLTILFLKDIEDCDIIVIALQECKYNVWIEKLGAKMKLMKYTLLTVVTMWRMMMCIFVKNQHIGNISNLEVVSKPTGIANLIGNKGGMLVSFCIMETSFCFINCHLAAKPHNVELRKNNYYDLIKNMRTGFKELESIFQFDYVFWCGDFNFRNDLLFEKVAELCQIEAYKKLQENDQLTKERDENNIFSDFNEGPLNFRPTYRRIRNDDTWSNKKNQSPSWCDRVLFRTKPNSYLELLEYGSREQQYGSDHRPAYAKFEIEIETPYLGNPPLHLRKKNPDGFIRLNEINLEYDMRSLMNLNDFVTISYPFEISLTFSGRFLKTMLSTGSLKVDKYEEAYTFRWEKDQIPVLQAVVSDFKYLKSQHIVYTITAIDNQNNEVLIGQGYISLLDIIENNGTKTNYDTNACLFGKIIGVLQGTMEYDIEHAEKLIL